LAIIDTALNLYEVDKGTLPTDARGLEILLFIPNANKKPYLDFLPIDPWQRKNHYRYPGKHRTSSYDLSSSGADGKEGTEDDITNWQ